MSGQKIRYQIVNRRPGDVASYYADPSAALRLLGWRATYSIEQMCADQWRWQSNHLSY